MHANILKIKKPDGKVYRYVQIGYTYRVGHQVKRKTIANLGRLDDLLENGSLDALITSLQKVKNVA